MHAASTEFVADSALDVALPPPMPSLPPDPSRAPYPLPQSIGADASLRSLLRRDFEGVVHSEMPCAHAHTLGASADVGAGSACRMRGAHRLVVALLLWKHLGRGSPVGVSLRAVKAGRVKEWGRQTRGVECGSPPGRAPPPETS